MTLTCESGQSIGENTSGRRRARKLLDPTNPRYGESCFGVGTKGGQRGSGGFLLLTSLASILIGCDKPCRQLTEWNRPALGSLMLSPPRLLLLAPA
jgi:hypothetical protein